MICFINIACKDNLATRWLEHSRLDFKQTIIRNTGELEQLQKAKYRGLTFSISPLGACSVRGSLHVFYHGDNFGDFTASELWDCIEMLRSDFGIDPTKANLRGLESELNISTKQARKIRRSAVCHKHKSFDKRDNGFIKECDQSAYVVKMYDKSKGRKQQIRCGVRFKEMRILKPKGVELETLADLLNMEVLGSLVLATMEEFDKVLFYDGDSDLHALTDKEIIKYKDFRSGEYWESLTRGQRHRQKPIYERLSAKAGVIDYRHLLLGLMRSKYSKLITMDKLKGGEYPPQFSQKVDTLTPQNGIQLRQLLQTVDTDKRYTITDFSLSAETYPNVPTKKHGRKHPTKRGVFVGVCSCCGGTMEGKRKGAKYCSAKCRIDANNAKRKHKRERQRANDILTLGAIGADCFKTVGVKMQNGKSRRLASLKALGKWNKNDIQQIAGLSFGKAGKIGAQQSKRYADEIVRLEVWRNAGRVLSPTTWEQVANRRLLALSKSFRASTIKEVRYKHRATGAKSKTEFWRVWVYPRYGIGWRTCLDWLSNE